MVMPRSRSRSMLSSSWLSISRAETALHFSSSRSASVDLPWSIWAMMLKFRMLLCFVIFGYSSIGRSTQGPHQGPGAHRRSFNRNGGPIKSEIPWGGEAQGSRMWHSPPGGSAPPGSLLSQGSSPGRRFMGPRHVLRSTESRSARPRTGHSHSVPQIPASWRGSPPDFPLSGGPPPFEAW